MKARPSKRIPRVPLIIAAVVLAFFVVVLVLLPSNIYQPPSPPQDTTTTTVRHQLSSPRGVKGDKRGTGDALPISRGSTGVGEQLPPQGVRGPATLHRIAPPVEVQFPFLPKHVKKAIAAFEAAGSGRAAVVDGGANSVGVTRGDVAIAARGLVYRLPSVVIRGGEEEGQMVEGGRSDVGGDSSNSDKDGTTAERIFNAIKDDIQASARDGRPMIADFGCVLGGILAKAHPNSTVICVHEGTTTLPVSTLTNLIHIATPGSFMDPKFIQFYEMCNFFTIAIAMYPLLRRDQQQQSSSSLAASTTFLLSHLASVMPSSAAIYTSVPTPAVEVLLTKNPSEWSSKSKEEVGNAAAAADADGREKEGTDGGSVSSATSSIDGVIARELTTVTFLPSESSSSSFTIVELLLIKSSRMCRKTWNAPLVQWGRSQSVSFNEGLIALKVQSVTTTAVAGGGGGAAAKSDEHQRFIHPLQYISSVNLDTLLGVGLDAIARTQILGQMITTPRYSDPLPHNWVVGGGGKVLRIDKIDKRYDSKVDENKGYWGRSTAGYLHLLTFHTCLPVHRSELPAILFEMAQEANTSNINANSESTCPGACERCTKSCSYLPKGSPPCIDCVTCGAVCVSRRGTDFLRKKHQSKKGGMSPNVGVPCQRTYSSMHAARKVWAKWGK